jgi:hypothetical protein
MKSPAEPAPDIAITVAKTAASAMQCRIIRPLPQRAALTDDPGSEADDADKDRLQTAISPS